MGKLRQISIALALALMLCVTMLGTGAFAQSVAHNNARVIATNTFTPNAQPVAQPATTDLQQVGNRGFCRWVPGHWMMVRFWVPGYWTWYPYRHWVPGHWASSWRWTPGHWYPYWCGWSGVRR